MSLNNNILQQFVNYNELHNKDGIQYQTKLKRVKIKYFKQSIVVLSHIRKFKVLILFILAILKIEVIRVKLNGKKISYIFIKAKDVVKVCNCNKKVLTYSNFTSIVGELNKTEIIVSNSF